MAKKYIKNIIFSKTPLKGIYRFADEFQIYPINLEGYPISKNTKHFPLIIEFHYEESEITKVKPFDGDEDNDLNEMVSQSSFQTNKLIQITNLLSTITNYRFFFYRYPEMSWSVPIPEEVTDENRDELNKTSSAWSAKLYFFKDMWKQLQIKEFSTPQFEAVELIPQRKYYWYDPIESKEKEITLPNTINTILYHYFNLDAKEREIVDSSIHQFCNGIDLFDNMKSLSFFSFVSSIETMVNYEFRDDIVEYDCNDCKSLKASSYQCQKCGNPIWGIAAKFREYLFRYVSNSPEGKKLYNAVYNIRSKITHTGYLLSGDKFLDWDFSDKTEEINMKHLEAMQLCRRSLANWLLNKEASC